MDPSPEKAKDVDTKVAKRARDKATAAPTSGVGLIQSFFFSKKPAPTPPPPAPATAPAPASTKAGGGGSSGNGSGNARSSGDATVGRGMGARGVPPPVPPRSARFSNGVGGSGAGAGAGAEGGEADGCSEELNTLIEGAVPEEFAGKSWEGYLHHVDFIVALMHVGTSLIPKSLIKVTALVGRWIGRLVDQWGNILAGLPIDFSVGRPECRSSRRSLGYRISRQVCR